VKAMARYSYKVVPAPSKGRKAAGVKGAEARFAHGLEEAINEYAAHGWEYLRADILPSEERQGLTSTATVYRSVLVFRRAEEDTAQEAAAPVAPAEPAPERRFIRAAPPLTATRKPDPEPGTDPDPEQDAPPDAEPEQTPTRRQDPDATDVSGEEPPETDETDETATPEGEDTPRG